MFRRVLVPFLLFLFGLPAAVHGQRVFLGRISLAGEQSTISWALHYCQLAYPSSNDVSLLGAGAWACYYSPTGPVSPVVPPGSTSGNQGSGRRGSGGRNTGNEQSASVPGEILDLTHTGLRLHAFDGMNIGIVFQRRSHYAIGIAEVIDMGFLDAVDVWSNIGSGFSVCFPQIGRIVFLDAATSPRAILFPEYHHEDGYTCASMSIAGTMVLVETDEEPAATPAPIPTIDPATFDDIADAIELEGCTVTPRVNLVLRQAPWAIYFDIVHANSPVPAKARTDSWFNVTYDGNEGWIAAWFVNSDGDCDWTE